MKKYLYTLLLLLSVSAVPANAQLYKDLSPKLRFGLTAGLNIPQTSVGNDELEQYVDKIAPGFFAGPTVTFLMPAVGIGFDLSAYYDQRGAKSDTYDTPSVISRMVQIPLNVRYSFDMGAAMPFVFVGAQYGLNIGDKSKVIAMGRSSSTQQALNREWHAENSVLSLNFGVGILAMEKVQARVSYNLPLQKTGEIYQVNVETGKISNSYRTDCKFGACQVSVTYLF